MGTVADVGTQNAFLSATSDVTVATEAYEEVSHAMESRDNAIVYHCFS